MAHTKKTSHRTLKAHESSADSQKKSLKKDLTDKTAYSPKHMIACHGSGCYSSCGVDSKK